MGEDKRARPVLPASILVEGRACLVVGGGTIAARKTGHLLAAQAEVTVVSPGAGKAILELAAEGRIQHIDRPFAEPDVQGMYLVFAATNDVDVNRNVIACGRREGILCSAIDSNWTDGDFVTPAICRQDDLTVSVSTGGSSCRRARIVKDRIAEFIKSMPPINEDHTHP